jgi:sulfopyruvate decarboxylase alpha subunit
MLKQTGVSQIAYVPDAGHKRLIQLANEDPAISAISLTTEEEGVALAAGTYLGGAKAILLMQSSGVGNCINMFSLIKTCQFPFLTLVTMRGDFGEGNGWQFAMGQIAEKCMTTAGLICLRANDEESIEQTVSAGITMAFVGGQAVAVLISQRALGAKSFG